MIEGRDVAPVLTGGPGATVLRLMATGHRSTYLKYGRGATTDDIADEAARLHWLQGRMPCAPLIEHGRVADGAWLLTEALPGRVAGDWLRDEPASSPRVIARIAEFVRCLHALPVSDCPFDASVAGWLPEARRRVMQGLVDEDDFDADHVGWTAAAVLAEVERLAPHAADHVVVHGDLTLGNVLIDEGGRATGCIDVGRLGRGESLSGPGTALARSRSIW